MRPDEIFAVVFLVIVIYTILINWYRNNQKPE